MAEVIRMPRMSDTMEEGVIVGWLKKVGDKVEPGDILAEVETDKATMELESYQEGTILYIGVKEGPVPVNGILAVIGEEGEEYDSLLEAESTKEIETNGSEEPASEQDKKTSSSGSKPERTVVQNDEPVTDGTRIKASPLAKKMASDSGIDLSSIKGSGEGGRIVKVDVEKKLEQLPLTAPGVYKVGQAREIVVSQMRKTIARRLSESKFTSPHFYITLEVDVSNLMESRKRINEDAPPKISLNDFIVKAVAMTLRKHPAVNCSWLGDKIKYHGDIHIGVAVAVEDGLIVPVLRFADQKSLSQINTEIKTLADRGRNKKLQPEEMQGNTFTVSNLGMFDVEEFTAIINPPDACILAVGTVIEKPVAVNGEIKIGRRMRMNLSCDHRVVDGATGAQFLQTLKSYLEDPVKLLV
jgi:pyruvate dehydrogenase E2 component (dihydrolipoamide acetyltransferase)